MKTEQLKKFLMDHDSSIKDAMKKIQENGSGMVFVMDEEGRLVGSVADGDIRRAVLRDVPINEKIKKIANPRPVTLPDNIEEYKFPLKVPLVDSGGKVSDVLIVFISTMSIDKYRQVIGKDKG